MKDKYCYMWHEVNAAKRIPLDEKAEWEAEGWADQPGAFFNIEEMGYDKKDQRNLDQLITVVMGQVNFMNFIANFKYRTRQQLIDWAKAMLDMDLKMKKKSKMIEELEFVCLKGNDTII